MELQPQQTLERLTQAMKDLRSPHKDREETRQQLRRAIAQAEIEVSNLSHRPRTDRAAKCLEQDLTCLAELARGSLPRE
jgi:hypothetical protein